MVSRLVVKAYWTFAALGGIYAIILGLLTQPLLQRHALYAHKIHTGTWWNNISEPETFGFAKNQVTPFYLPTPDGERLYCWHILPLSIYAQHQDTITTQPAGPVADFTTTTAHALLRADPTSRIVINFHGNAGHLAQGHRTQTYASITALPAAHLLTCDYRGFGLSSGSPSEQGLITDALTLTSFVLHTLNHPPARTLILGQSLGTAVASATSLFYLDPHSPLLPASLSNTTTSPPPTPISFASTILVAPFPSLPALLLKYRIAGLIPVLGPLKGYPKLLAYMTARIIDPWPTLPRWQAAFATARALNVPLNLHILHARNDADIPFAQGEALFEGVSAVMRDGVGSGEQSVLREIHERRSEVGDAVRRGAWAYRRCVDGEGVRVGDDGMAKVTARRRVELEITRWGGHNRIVAGAQVALAVRRAFEEAA
ncbi:alpha/beta-hydrolase [Pseudovirgaria hyperparasitica]|uniref:Alpha/beta-hydrolase n=1 Tax=Pseudovirgaria hyperparasitica TaxID=470096 RepID=A0A6A6W0I3_9PEZI|nr:alpha/beta-hydrolase [Pseudovirgaria hyperparasitica]KAF2755494.1 alpha/beta-hydrolase [Pseudovirgaria hyperparasitica]